MCSFSLHDEAINTLPSLRNTVDNFGLSTKKSLGQNFLFDLNLTDKIARAAGDLSTATVIEIGPGPGGLTRALLLNHAQKLIVIERDERAIPILKQLRDIVGNRLSINNEDALKIDYTTLVKQAGGTLPYKIVANLPYNIATELLFKWLDHIDDIDSMTLMFQKEVAQRIAAKPGEKLRGVVSVLAQFYCECIVVFDVNPNAFFPPPKVISSVIHIRKKTTPSSIEISFSQLKHVTKTLFQQRRKTLRRSAKNLWPDSEKLLEMAAIDPQERPENLSVEDFCTIAKHLAELQKG